MKKEIKPLNLNLFYGAVLAIGLSFIFLYPKDPKPFELKYLYIYNSDLDSISQNLEQNGWKIERIVKKYKKDNKTGANYLLKKEID